MKLKLIFALVTLVVLNMKSYAQVNNWDSVMVDGFGSNLLTYQIQEYNNALYVGTEHTGPGIAPNIFMSTSGDQGTWTTTTFSATASVNDVNIQSMEVDHNMNVLYVGTQNAEDGGSIYSYDGAAWTNISGVIPPWDSSYVDVVKILLHSTGGNDTIYAFLNNNYDSRSQIWKTSKANISWSLVLDLPLQYTAIKDAIVYNDSIYFIKEDSYIGASFIYRLSSAGDTTKTHLNPGVNDPGNYFKSLGIHNNVLYAGSQNYSVGANLLSYTSGTGWQVVSADGLGFGGDFGTIYDIYSFRNKLWIMASVQQGSFDMGGARLDGNNQTLGGPISACAFVSNDGINFKQSSSSGFREYYNDGAAWSFSSLGGNIYAGGLTYAGIGGQIWRSLVPSASFVTDFGTTCVNMFENYSNTSLDAYSYQWYINSTPLSTNSSTNYVYPSPGPYYISLVAYSSDSLYKDSIAMYKNVTPMLDATGLGNFNVCEFDSIHLGDAFGISGGTTPYTYNWYDGSNTYTVANPALEATTNLTYTLTLMDVHSCVKTTTVSVNVNSSTDLVGHVTTSLSANVDDGFVYAFRYQPGAAGLDTAAMVPLLSGSGDYNFASLDSGLFLIKVLPNPATFASAVPTYYGDVFQWDSSTVVIHGCAQTDTADIQVLEIPATTGPGFISGYVLEGDGFGQGLRWFDENQPNIPFVPGGPLKGIDVKLGKNPGGGIQARIMTDSTGYYEFDSLPLQGYKIYVDIPNLPMDSTRELVLSVGSDISLQNNYFADSNSVYILDSAVAVGIYASEKVFENKFSIYPNPAKGIFNVSYQLNNGENVSIEIVNALGAIVWNEKNIQSIVGENVISLSAVRLNNGVYFINLFSEGKKYSQRLVVIE